MTSSQRATQIDGVADALKESLDYLSSELEAQAEALKQITPYTKGAVIAVLRGCGQQCLGCPHVTYVRYLPQAKYKEFVPSANVKHPLKVPFSRIKAYADVHEDVRIILQTMRALSVERAAILAAAAALRRQLVLRGWMATKASLRAASEKADAVP
jgi:hypothetical protein